YQATLEFFNEDNSFGQKVLTSFTFDDFDIEDLNSTNLEVSNYTLNLNYKTDYSNLFIPYMYVVYRNGLNILSKEIIQGSNENGLISFKFLPNFKPLGSVDIDVYISFSSSKSLTETFSYFYSKTYSVNFIDSNGIILDSYPTASILVDGAITNLSTRAFVPLTQGEHTITLTKDGYDTSSFSINYSSFDYIFTSLKANSNIQPQASVSDFDFGNLLSNEASFTNITVFAPEKNSQMYLFSNSKMFSLFPSSIVGSQVITVIADARWGSIGKNSGSFSFSYNGVRNSIKLTSNVELIGANLTPNPNDFTVRVDDKLFFDVFLNSNVPVSSLSFKIDYPKDYLEFVNYQSNYVSENDDSLNFSFDLLNFKNDTPIISLTFKAIKETDYKLVVSFSNVKSDAGVSVISKPITLTILPPFVKPSKVANIKLENNVGKVQFSFSKSLKGSYDIRRYEIFRSTQPDITTSVYVGDTTTTTFTDSGPFEYGINYYYWVIAVDEKENASDPSNVFSVRPIVFSDTTVKNVKIELYIGSPFIYINGIKMSMDTTPIIIDGRTFVPVRYVVEPLGAKVVWKNTGSVIIIFKNSVIELFIGNPLASVNGNPVPIDKDNPKIVPFIKDGRTMVPLRFILENFGAEVNWDGKLKKITIVYGV
ncbi:MAG: copper amine oxidase N-terminal domain-containing protein, partial [Caldisericaceae bacterium]